MTNTKTFYHNVSDWDGGLLEDFGSRCGDSFFAKCIHGEYSVRRMTAGRACKWLVGFIVCACVGVWWAHLLWQWWQTGFCDTLTSAERSGSGVELRTRLREPGFESCAAVLKPWASFFTLHCSSSLSCINEYLAIDSGGYVYEQSSCTNCSISLDAS